MRPIPVRRFWSVLLLFSPMVLAGRAQAPVEPNPAPAAAISCPAPDGTGASLQALLRRAVEVQKLQDRAEPNFAWHEHEVTRQWDHNKVVHLEDETWDVSTVHGEEYRRLIARNGHPLTPEAAQKEQKKEEEFIRKHEPKDEEDRARITKKRQEEQAKDDRRDEALLSGFHYTLTGSKPTPWGPAWVLHAEPLPTFHPDDKELKMMTHFTGDVWIEARGCHAVRLRLQVREPISFGWFLGKLDRGGVVMLDFAPIASGNWFLHQVGVSAQGRILFKHLDITSKLAFTDYRRFQVNSRILPAMLAPAGGTPP